jgi:hypothetical protein
MKSVKMRIALRVSNIKGSFEKYLDYPSFRRLPAAVRVVPHVSLESIIHAPSANPGLKFR